MAVKKAKRRYYVRHKINMGGFQIAYEEMQLKPRRYAKTN